MLKRVITWVINKYYGAANETPKLVLSFENDTQGFWYMENTPFAVSREEGVYYVIVGKYRLSEGHASKEEAAEWASVITWEKIYGLVMALYALDKIKEEELTKMQKV